MKKISLVFVAAMLLFTGSIFANDVKDNDPAKIITKQISKMLDRNNNFTESEIDASAQVRFTVNQEGEIVVLSVDTENSSLESYVKGRLNYKKLEAISFDEGKLFTVSVRIAS